MSRRTIRTTLQETDLASYVDISDDFHGPNTSSGDICNLNWRTGNVGGNNGTLTAVELGAVGSYSGQRTITGGVGAGAGGFAIRTRIENLTSESFPVGGTMSWRVRPSTTTSMQWYCGLTDPATTPPLVAAGNSFIGLRYNSLVDTNVRFVVKDGAAAGNEDTASFGAPSTATFQTYTVRRTALDTYVLSSAGVVLATLTGVTNLPPVTTTLELEVAAVAIDVNDVTLDIDFVKIHGPLDRR